MNTKIGCVILSAGKSERMYSELPKALFPICGKSMIEYILESVEKLNFERVYVVVGHKGGLVKEKIISSSSIKKLKKNLIFVEQKQQLGSGHALLQVKPVIEKKINMLLVLPCDVPLIETETIKNLLLQHRKENTQCCVLTAITQNPTGYGRIIRDEKKKFVGIIEENELSEPQKKIKEVNTGIYSFLLPDLWNALKKVSPENKKGEYYLTDTIKFLSTKTTYLCSNSTEVLGVNTRVDIALVEEIVRKKVIQRLMLSGVSILMPETVYIDINSSVDCDTTIYPGCILKDAYIGKNCEIGPYTFIEKSVVDIGTKIIFSYITNSKIGKNCKIGPFSRIRPEVVINDNVSIGNFVEIKKSVINEGCKINHLSYVGDAEIGQEVNIGAGVITCNYDGIKKHKTIIGEKCFIGSNVNLIAPIRIGNKVVIAAGSTVTRDVPSSTLVVARAEEEHKPDHKIVHRIYNKR